MEWQSTTRSSVATGIIFKRLNHLKRKIMDGIQNDQLEEHPIVATAKHLVPLCWLLDCHVRSPVVRPASICIITEPVAVMKAQHCAGK